MSADALVPSSLLRTPPPSGDGAAKPPESLPPPTVPTPELPPDSTTSDSPTGELNRVSGATVDDSPPVEDAPSNAEPSSTSDRSSPTPLRPDLPSSTGETAIAAPSNARISAPIDIPEPVISSPAPKPPKRPVRSLQNLDSIVRKLTCVADPTRRSVAQKTDPSRRNSSAPHKVPVVTVSLQTPPVTSAINSSTQTPTSNGESTKVLDLTTKTRDDDGAVKAVRWGIMKKGGVKDARKKVAPPSSAMPSFVGPPPPQILSPESFSPSLQLLRIPQYVPQSQADSKVRSEIRVVGLTGGATIVTQNSLTVAPSDGDKSYDKRFEVRPTALVNPFPGDDLSSRGPLSAVDGFNSPPATWLPKGSELLDPEKTRFTVPIIGGGKKKRTQRTQTGLSHYHKLASSLVTTAVAPAPFPPPPVHLAPSAVSGAAKRKRQLKTPITPMGLSTLLPPTSSFSTQTVSIQADGPIKPKVNPPPAADFSVANVLGGSGGAVSVSVSSADTRPSNVPKTDPAVIDRLKRLGTVIEIEEDSNPPDKIPAGAPSALKMLEKMTIDPPQSPVVSALDDRPLFLSKDISVFAKKKISSFAQPKNPLLSIIPLALPPPPPKPVDQPPTKAQVLSKPVDQPPTKAQILPKPVEPPQAPSVPHLPLLTITKATPKPRTPPLVGKTASSAPPNSTPLPIVTVTKTAGTQSVSVTVEAETAETIDTVEPTVGEGSEPPLTLLEPVIVIDEDESPLSSDGKFIFKADSTLSVELPNNQKVFSCDICSAVFHHLHMLRKHYFRLHVARKYISEKDLEAYNIDPEKSDDCNDEFIYRCHTCRQCLPTKSELKSHLTDHPPLADLTKHIKGAKDYKCERCNAHFKWRKMYGKHKKSCKATPVAKDLPVDAKESDLPAKEPIIPVSELALRQVIDTRAVRNSTRAQKAAVRHKPKRKTRRSVALAIHSPPQTPKEDEDVPIAPQCDTVEEPVAAPFTSEATSVAINGNEGADSVKEVVQSTAESQDSVIEDVIVNSEEPPPSHPEPSNPQPAAETTKNETENVQNQLEKSIDPVDQSKSTGEETAVSVAPDLADVSDSPLADVIDPPLADVIDPPLADVIDPPLSDVIDPPLAEVIDPPLQPIINEEPVVAVVEPTSEDNSPEQDAVAVSTDTSTDSAVTAIPSQPEASVSTLTLSTDKIDLKTLAHCLYCNETFVNGIKKRNHTLSTHSHVRKNHKCIFCTETDDTFPSTVALFNHLLTVHPTVYFACQPCKERFHCLEDLKDHFSKRHSLDGDELKALDKRVSEVTEETSSFMCSSCQRIWLFKSCFFKHKCNPDKDRLPNSDKTGGRLPKLRKVKVVERSDRTDKSLRVDPETMFYSQVSLNVRNNLLHFLDGKLPQDDDEDDVEYEDEKVPERNTLNFSAGFSGAGLTLIPEPEPYSRVKAQWEKYNFPKNYDGRCGLTSYIKDMSYLDLSTQLIMRRNLQRLQGNAGVTSPDTSDDVPSVLALERLATQCAESFGFNGSAGGDAEAQSLGELSGEWVRDRVYICSVCSWETPCLWAMEDHKYEVHPQVLCPQHELVGDNRSLANTIYKRVIDDVDNPFLPERPHLRPPPVNKVPCTKCGVDGFGSRADIHVHILSCAGEPIPHWARTPRKRRWPKKRRRPRRGLKRNIPSTPHRPIKVRTKPGDTDTIQKMIANLPAKRSTRRVIGFEDDLKTRSQSTIQNCPVLLPSSRLVLPPSNSAHHKTSKGLKSPPKPKELILAPPLPRETDLIDTSAERGDVLSSLRMMPVSTPREELLEPRQIIDKVLIQKVLGQSVEGPSSHPCTGCGQTSESRNALRKHQKGCAYFRECGPNAEHKCKTCARLFNNLVALIEHSCDDMPKLEIEKDLSPVNLIDIPVLSPVRSDKESSNPSVKFDRSLSTKSAENGDCEDGELLRKRSHSLSDLPSGKKFFRPGHRRSARLGNVDFELPDKPSDCQTTDAEDTYESAPEPQSEPQKSKKLASRSERPKELKSAALLEVKALAELRTSAESPSVGSDFLDDDSVWEKQAVVADEKEAKVEVSERPKVRKAKRSRRLYTFKKKKKAPKGKLSKVQPVPNEEIKEEKIDDKDPTTQKTDLDDVDVKSEKNESDEVHLEESPSELETKVSDDADNDSKTPQESVNVVEVQETKTKKKATKKITKNKKAKEKKITKVKLPRKPAKPKRNQTGNLESQNKPKESAENDKNNDVSTKEVEMGTVDLELVNSVVQDVEPVNSEAEVVKPVNSEVKVDKPVNSEVKVDKPVNSEKAVKPVKSEVKVDKPVNSEKAAKPVKSGVKVVKLVNSSVKVIRKKAVKVKLSGKPTNQQRNQTNNVESSSNKPKSVFENAKSNELLKEIIPVAGVDVEPVNAEIKDSEVVNSVVGDVETVNSAVNDSEMMNSLVEDDKRVDSGSKDGVVNSEADGGKPVNSSAKDGKPVSSTVKDGGQDDHLAMAIEAVASGTAETLIAIMNANDLSNRVELKVDKEASKKGKVVKTGKMAKGKKVNSRTAQGQVKGKGKAKKTKKGAKEAQGGLKKKRVNGALKKTKKKLKKIVKGDKGETKPPIRRKNELERLFDDDVARLLVDEKRGKRSSIKYEEEKIKKDKEEPKTEETENEPVEVVEPEKQISDLKTGQKDILSDGIRPDVFFNGVAAEPTKAVEPSPAAQPVETVVQKPDNSENVVPPEPSTETKPVVKPVGNRPFGNKLLSGRLPSAGKAAALLSRRPLHNLDPPPNETKKRKIFSSGLKTAPARRTTRSNSNDGKEPDPYDYNDEDEIVPFQEPRFKPYSPPKPVLYAPPPIKRRVRKRESSPDTTTIVVQAEVHPEPPPRRRPDLKPPTIGDESTVAVAAKRKSPPPPDQNVSAKKKAKTKTCYDGIDVLDDGPASPPQLVAASDVTSKVDDVRRPEDTTCVTAKPNVTYAKDSLQSQDGPGRNSVTLGDVSPRSSPGRSPKDSPRRVASPSTRSPNPRVASPVTISPSRRDSPARMAPLRSYGRPRVPSPTCDEPPELVDESKVTVDNGADSASPLRPSTAADVFDPEPPALEPTGDLGSLTKNSPAMSEDTETQVDTEEDTDSLKSFKSVSKKKGKDLKLLKKKQLFRMKALRNKKKKDVKKNVKGAPVKEVVKVAGISWEVSEFHSSPTKSDPPKSASPLPALPNLVKDWESGDLWDAPIVPLSAPAPVPVASGTDPGAPSTPPGPVPGPRSVRVDSGSTTGAISSLGSILDSVNKLLNEPDSNFSSLPSHYSLADLQKAMGASDAEMAVLQQLGEAQEYDGPSVSQLHCEEDWGPLLIDLDNQAAQQPIVSSSVAESSSESPTADLSHFPSQSSSPLFSSTAHAHTRYQDLTGFIKNSSMCRSLRLSPKCSSTSLLAAHTNKEVVCPTCSCHFMGFPALQIHVDKVHGSAHDPAQVTGGLQNRRVVLESVKNSSRLVCFECQQILPSHLLYRHLEVEHGLGPSNITKCSTVTGDPHEGPVGGERLKSKMSSALGDLLDKAVTNLLTVKAKPETGLSGSAMELLSRLCAVRKRDTSRINPKDLSFNKLKSETKSEDDWSRPSSIIKPYLCSVCGQRFPLAASRNKHEVLAHRSFGQTEEAVVKEEFDDDDWRDAPSPTESAVDDGAGIALTLTCSDCGLSFESVSDLMKHRVEDHGPRRRQSTNSEAGKESAPVTSSTAPSLVKLPQRITSVSRSQSLDTNSPACDSDDSCSTSGAKSSELSSVAGATSSTPTSSPPAKRKARFRANKVTGHVKAKAEAALRQLNISQKIHDVLSSPSLLPSDEPST